VPNAAANGAAMDTDARKSRHLDICLEDDVASRRDTGFGAVRLQHEAMPEFALADVDCSAQFLGFRLRAPLLISSMTGGTHRAREINRRLAAGAEAAGIALGLGSGRAALEHAHLAHTYAVRDVAPTIPLFANLGAVQLNYGVSVDDARRLIELHGASALYLHFNPLQEALQLHGDTNFRDLLPKIARLCGTLGVPVFAKGVGSGLGVKTALRLVEAGIAAIDVAGAGGTSWALVEGRRTNDPSRERMAEAFGDWGLATARATAEIRRALPEIPLVASGGIRNGVEMAKAIALGADLCGVALPFLEAAHESEEAVHELVAELVATLRIAQFASGSRRLIDLRAALIG
jgi:isopentenyl-diphosphate delta-isomerase